MQGRGLAVAWGLLAVLVAGTVAWLVLTGEPEHGPASTASVSVEVPAFPEAPPKEAPPQDASPPGNEPPAAEPSPHMPTGSGVNAPEPVREQPAHEPAETAEEQPGPAAPAEPETHPSEPAVGTAPEAAHEPPPTPEATPKPEGELGKQETAGAQPEHQDQDRDQEVAHAKPEAQSNPPAEPATEHQAAVAPPLPEKIANEPAPPEPAPQADHGEHRGAPSTAAGEPARTPKEPAPASSAHGTARETPPAHREEHTQPQPAETAGTATAGKPTHDNEHRSEAEATAEPLPPTVEVGTLRPVPGEILQPLRPPESKVDPALTEKGPFGPLPAVAPDGRKPWKAYSRPYPAKANTPRIAIVIGNLGLARNVTEAAINDLPPLITLSFAPYADNVEGWVAKARAAGHEAMLDLPMEPIDYPKNDPGPKALFTNLETNQNIERLQWVLSRAVGYVGVTNFMGSRFTTSPDDLRPVLKALRDRGLMFLDSRSAARSLATTMASQIKLPRAVNDRFIDVKASRAAIDRRLGELENIATREGAAVGIGYPYPVTIDRVARWAKAIDERKDLSLAPISAVVGRQADR